MKPFVTTKMTEAQLETLVSLNQRIRKIPDDFVLPSCVEVISCQMLAHALSAFEYPLNLTLQEGTFRLGFEHAWFTDELDCIYDPYPVGMTTGMGHSAMFVDRFVAKTGELYESLEMCRKRFHQKWQETRDELFHPSRAKNYLFKNDTKFRLGVRKLVQVMT